MDEETTLIMDALSTLDPHQLLDLNHSILSFSHLHHRRLYAILSSPSLFSVTLDHLLHLSLPYKALLIARHLLSLLQLLTIYFQYPIPSSRIKLRDLDAALILLLFCETHHHDSQALETTNPSEWRITLRDVWCDSMLTNLSGLDGGVLIPYIELVIRCRRFICSVNGSFENPNIEVAAARAFVVALPTVEVRGILECVICKEDMIKGRDVCELPCKHLFHWICILSWFNKRNTCPCCRFPLPTDNVFGEIQRLWGFLVKASRLRSKHFTFMNIH